MKLLLLLICVFQVTLVYSQKLVDIASDGEEQSPVVDPKLAFDDGASITPIIVPTFTPEPQTDVCKWTDFGTEFSYTVHTGYPYYYEEPTRLDLRHTDTAPYKVFLTYWKNRVVEGHSEQFSCDEVFKMQEITSIINDRRYEMRWTGDYWDSVGACHRSDNERPYSHKNSQGFYGIGTCSFTKKRADVNVGGIDMAIGRWLYTLTVTPQAGRCCRLKVSSVGSGG